MNYIVDDIGAVVNLMRGDKKLLPVFKLLKFDVSTFDNTFDESFTGTNNTPPFYMYGHRLEIANRLKEMENDKIRKYQKYPLIALRMDIAEANANGIIVVNLNLAILALTKGNMYTPERMDKVFKPVLYPLYESFFEAIKKSGKFFWKGEIGEKPPHVKLDRPSWGTGYSPPKEGNEAGIFADPLDAIEIVNLELKQLKKC